MGNVFIPQSEHYPKEEWTWRGIVNPDIFKPAVPEVTIDKAETSTDGTQFILTVSGNIIGTLLKENFEARADGGGFSILSVAYDDRNLTITLEISPVALDTDTGLIVTHFSDDTNLAYVLDLPVTNNVIGGK